MKGDALVTAAQLLVSNAPALELEQLYRSHADRVLRAAYRITGSMADAEDVLQTIFLRLARREEQDVGNAESYLYRSAINAAVDLLRSRRDAKRVPIEDMEHRLEAAQAGPADLDGMAQALRAALSQLNARAAEMFALRYFEEMDNRQIADVMNTSQAVVAVTLFRTRQQLQKSLKDYRTVAR